MDKKSKSLFILAILLVVASVAFTFYRTVIVKDFEILEIESSVLDTDGVVK